MVIRQDFETTIPELYGQTCTSFLGVVELDGECSLLYLQLLESWHRFYQDAGVLFWQEGSAPDEDNDLYGGASYQDLGKSLNVVGSTIIAIEKSDPELKLLFNNGACLRIQNTFEVVDGKFGEEVRGKIVEFLPGSANSS